MKSLIFLSLAALFSVQTIQSQVIDSTMTESKKKSLTFISNVRINLRKPGLSCLLQVAAQILTSYLIASNAGIYSDEMTAGALIFLAGAGSTVASIPLFITAHNHKRRPNSSCQQGTLDFKVIPLMIQGMLRWVLGFVFNSSKDTSCRLIHR